MNDLNEKLLEWIPSLLYYNKVLIFIRKCVEAIPGIMPRAEYLLTLAAYN